MLSPEMKMIGDELIAVISGLFDPLAARVKTCEKALEERACTIRYAGVWKQEKTYQAGVFATHDGSLWHCNEKTETRPGTGPHWTLAVKGYRP